MIFGWGKKSKIWKINDDSHLLAVWKYFHILWCPIGYNVQWHIVGDKRSEDQIVSYEKVKELFPNETPDLNWWQKYGLIYVIAGLIIISLFSNQK